VRWGGGAGEEELWSRTHSGVHAVGDVDGDVVDDVVAGTIRFHGIEPPYSVDGVDGSNSLLRSYALGLSTTKAASQRRAYSSMRPKAWSAVKVSSVR
jgi:hypothetical protein